VSVTVSAAPQADYTLTSATSLTVAAGKSGSLALTVTPQNGFKSTLTFTCSNLPTGAACTFNPQSVTPSGAAVSTTLSLSVPKSAVTLAAPLSDRLPGGRNPAPLQAAKLFAFALIASLGIFGFAAGKGQQRVQRRFAPVLAGAFALAALAVGVSCAGYTGSGSQPPPSQTYTITVTASGASAPTHSENITLTVP
jgi:hypothetical protein